MKRGVMLAFVLGLVLAVAVFAQVSFVSAGVGLKWDNEARMVIQGERTCFTYSVYNPWPKDSYVIIDVSPELRDLLTSRESEVKFVVANTPSESAIPVQFCFDVPYVYSSERDCWIGNYICAQTCNAEPKVFSGEAIATEVNSASSAGGAGSTTSAAVSAPLKIRVVCDAHGRDYTLLFIALAIISGLVIVWMVVRKYRKPKVQRDMEKLKALKEQIKREKGK